ncbi:MAG: Lar family restriction alleviation protein [Synergistaceae bacterium]|nr:Lar family restriction alleviation protein [Synergistaceae bacterium]
MVEELKACPLCNAPARLYSFPKKNLYRVTCANCFFSSEWTNTEQKAVEAWNTRKKRCRSQKGVEQIGGFLRPCIFPYRGHCWSDQTSYDFSRCIGCENLRDMTEMLLLNLRTIKSYIVKDERSRTDGIQESGTKAS